MLALATVPFAVIAAFLALFGFGAACVAVRLLAGELFDKVAGTLQSRTVRRQEPR